MNKVYDSPAAAIHDVFDGATIMFGGFAASGNPTNLVRALRTRGTKRITAIANNIGFGDSLDSLCEERQIEKMIASFAIRATGSHQSLFEQQYLRGEVELELVPQGTLAERIRAGGAGIPAFFVPAGVDTVVEEGKRTEDFDGRRYLLERALMADFALLKAYRADTLGNLVYRLGGRNFNVPMATAARTTIVEVEEIVEPGELDPELIVTPGIYVDRVVKAERHDVDWFK
jgi:3-oxoacid CoA-transferase subunit A